ncbi:transglutaminaseTgpA domain-containing protein [Nocardioides sp.]|uniref:transglutaminase family protein n=1 Tax=Nocardioides sp. TaxID=35761 RepID=UPI002637A638|nr:transglutaminaseTgpA domain-containing protein [Nocardioides sp.]
MARRTALALMVAATLLAALTSWTATVSWRVLTLDPGTWLGPSVVLAAVVVGIGLVGRAVRLPVAVVALGQAVIGSAVVSWQLVGSPVPVGTRWTDLSDQVVHAVRLSSHVRPPAPVEGGVLPLLLLGTVLSVLAVDLVAVGLRRAILVGPLLVAIWSVTFWNGPVRLPWWSIAAPSAGFCALLLLAQVLARWEATTAPGSTVRADARASVAVLTRATGIAATAIAAAIVIPHVVSTSRFDLMPSGGNGSDHEQLQVTNPMVSLHHDLVQGPDYDLLTVVTDDPSPSYMRMSVLTTFRGNQWSAGERYVPSANRVGGDLPLPTGMDASMEGAKHHYAVTASDRFASKWLPTQAPLTSLFVRGDWRYDSGTLDVMAADKDLTTAGARWTMNGFTPSYDASYLLGLSSTSLSGQLYTDLPRDFPDSVRALAREVTSHVTSPFAQAVALQDWFRTDGGFTYDTSTDLGDGTDDLVTFLGTGPDSRRGYCQQFAAAMAVMARALHIPARVAVGFLQPTETAPNTWVYSAHDLHAWPELYFAGAGWVRFEPTPSIRAATTPTYTDTSGVTGPTQSPTTVPTRRPSSAPSVAPTRKPSTQAPDTSASTSGSGPSRSTVTALVAGAALVVVLVALAAPALLRRRRRLARLHRATPEDLWAELRDTAVDLGAVWPDHASVRRQAATLRVDGAPADALARLRTGVEESRYAAAGTATATAQAQRGDLREVTTALRDAAGPRAKRRARVLPASLFRRRTP